MTASSSVQSQAFRFVEYFSHGVDERTGIYSVSTNFPTFVSNNLIGPDLNLVLKFNPMNALNVGMGIGWSWNLTEFALAGNILALYTGETYKQTGTTPDGTPVFKENRLGTFHFEVLGGGAYRVAHKNGLIEILRTLGSGTEQVALPHQMYSATGHRLDLAYENVGGRHMLKTITDADGTLLSIVRNADGSRVEIHFRPNDGDNGGPVATYTLHVNQQQLREIVTPTAEKASWRIEYELIRGTLCVKTVDTPTGAFEEVEYRDPGHIVPGLPALPNLPRVTRHVIHPDANPANVIETTYTYDSHSSNVGHNFLGNGGVTSRDEGLDPVYAASHTFRYGTTVHHLGDITTGGKTTRATVRTVTRTYNRFHALLEETTTQNNCIKTQETQYYDEDKPIEQQLPQFQMPKQTKSIWRLANNSNAYREEVRLSTYDIHGNQTEETDHTQVRTTYTYYLAAGETGCPADPDGFQRNLKETIVYPAPVAAGVTQAPILCTRLTYKDIKTLPGSESKGCLLPDLETQLVVAPNGSESELQHTTTVYHETPANVFLHGRAQQQTLTRGGKNTVTAYAYSLVDSVLAGEKVLQTVQTLTGFDHQQVGDPKPRHVQKVNTSQRSVNHGNDVLTWDDNDVTIRYRYNKLFQVIEEEVAPDDGTINAARKYSYTLTSVRGQQAQQTMTDVKGVVTRTYFDGLNQAVSEERQNVDDPAGGNTFLPTFAARYDIFGNKVEETVYDWPTFDAKTRTVVGDWPNGSQLLALTTRSLFNDWNEPMCTINPDGIKVFDELDHVSDSTWTVGPVQRTWKESADGAQTTGLTMALINAFGEPEIVRRYEALGDSKAYSESVNTVDGLGRTVKEVDARDNATEYGYDADGRITLTVLPGGARVVREYAVHSSEDLPTLIKVDADVLGTQTFDGLGRLYALTTGGRPQTFTFKDGQSRPDTVTTPKGVIRYEYQPQLSEEPSRRYLPKVAGEIEASYEYDAKNARMVSCEEDGLKLDRDYYSNGELKSETRVQGSASYTMHYGTSQMGLPISYSNVLGETQRYDYDRAGRLMSTQLGSTTSTFLYDDLGRTSQIQTRDGASQVTIGITYDAFEREDCRTFDLNGTQQVMTQKYNVVDLLVERNLSEGATVIRLEDYIYDGRNRLTTYRCEGTEQPQDPYGNKILAQAFQFNAIDNITRVLTTIPGGSNIGGYWYDGPDKTQLSRVTNNNTAAGYPALITLAYDENGNLTRDEEERILDYDALNRLLSVSASPGGASAKFSYDPLNTLAASGEQGTEEQRFYQKDELANVRGAANSSFMRGAGNVLAEQKDDAGPKS